jgi:hypothetical protein
MGQPFGAATQQIAATVRFSEVIASDEDSAREGQDALAMDVRLHDRHLSCV